MAKLHVKYAPILKFNANEQFYPMRTDDVLHYSSLHVKDQTRPVLARGRVTPQALVQHGRSPQTFLRTVTSGPLAGEDVIEGWSTGALEMVYRFSAASPFSLTEKMAKKAYSWFSPKTKKATQLFWWNDMLKPLLNNEISNVAENELPRLILPKDTEKSAIEAYQAESPGYTYYYRYDNSHPDYYCLQYWFFYSYNNWGCRFGGMNDHEGDWEGMMLFFAKGANGKLQEPPLYVTYADHESRQLRYWDHDDPDKRVIRDGRHPIGYVAAGSHATYPEAKTHPLMELYKLYDYARGDGITIDSSDWAHRINLDSADGNWLAEYQGSWGTRFWLPVAEAKNLLQTVLASTPMGLLRGLKVPKEIELPGVSAPYGPLGENRPQSKNAVKWAGVPPD